MKWLMVGGEFVHVKTFTACKPVKVIEHVNPLSFLETQDKFTIEFKRFSP
jgi:hypothetical protein